MWEVCLLLELFWSGIIFPRDFFHQHMYCCVRDCWRCRHGLIWEELFAKGTSTLGLVVPGALASGAFGSGCTVPWEIYKRSKCVKTLPHVENVSICHIDRNLITGSGCAVPCEISKRSKCVETQIKFQKLFFYSFFFLYFGPASKTL